MENFLIDNIPTNTNQLSFYSGLNLNLLPVAEKKELQLHGINYKFKKKSALYYEGDIPKGIYVLLTGKVKFARLNPDGTEQIFFIYTSGDIFGYRPILGGTRNMHSAIAIEDCELLFIERENFMFITKNSSHLSELVLNSVCRDFTFLTNMINIITKKSIRERTAYFLLILNEKYKLPGQMNNEAEIRVSRGDLASYIGSSLENLIRTLKEFKEKNYIHVVGKSIFIKDFGALHSLTDFRV